MQFSLAQRGRLLVVLDDLWDVELGRWLLRQVLPDDRVLLVSSRDAGLSRQLCGFVERLDVLPEADALALLANILGPLDRHEAAAKEVIRLVEGLPLALELAAKLCANGPADLAWVARQLQGKPALDVLKLEGQEVRETSVEACLALSYQGLETDLQRRFRALGVFAPAAYDLAALAVVWGDEDLEAAETVARGLLRRGLLTQVERGGEDGEALPVYRQHGLLRAYALTLLCQAKEEAEPAGRHASFYGALAKQDWQAGETYWDQVEHGWEWAKTHSLDEALAYLYRVSGFLILRDHWAFYRAIAEELLQRLQAQDDRLVDQARVLQRLGFIANALGEQAQALQYFQQSLSLHRQVGDQVGEAATLSNIGRVYDALDDKRQALAHFEQALPLSCQVGDKGGEAATLNNIGTVYAALGEQQRALDYYEQALPLFRQVGDRGGESVTRYNVAMVFVYMHRLAEAEDQLQQVVALDEAIQHPDLERNREMLARVRAMRQTAEAKPDSDSPAGQEG